MKMKGKMREEEAINKERNNEVPQTDGTESVEGIHDGVDDEVHASKKAAVLNAIRPGEPTEPHHSDVMIP